MFLANETLDLINASLEADGGIAYRTTLEKVLPTVADAYSSEGNEFRTHLGASVLGNKCSRAIWYGFRWVHKPKFEGRILRLFNRGHLEEGRVIALLLSAGIEVWSTSPDGKQFRITANGGHVGGSLDGVGRGIPELGKVPFLLEYKTHNDKSFTSLTTQGVAVSKPEHFVQMQLYMDKMGLGWALYIAVNKNTDHIHAEIVQAFPDFAASQFDRAADIVYSPVPLPKLNKSPGWYECRFCDFVNVCHNGTAPEVNCRTCEFSVPEPNGTWICRRTIEVLDKKKQLEGCGDYRRLI